MVTVERAAITGVSVAGIIVVIDLIINQTDANILEDLAVGFVAGFGTEYLLNFLKL